VRLSLEHASHPVKNAPTVVVHAPSQFDTTSPLQLVVYLHGWNGCAAVIEATGLVACRPEKTSEKAHRGWGLGERHDRANTNTLFVVPQLAFSARDGSPGRFAEKGFFRGFLDELLSEGLGEKLGGTRSIEDVERVTLVAHSAGFKTALAIMRQADAEELVREVVLFDALYAAPAVFAQWVAKAPEGQARKVVSLYTAKGRTYQFSQLLARYAVEHLGEDTVALEPAGALDEAIRGHSVVIDRSPVGHGSVPARHLAEVLRALDLRPRSTE
jgi:pimeloyl-ACP methyl ester carboxylesterase